MRLARDNDGRKAKIPSLPIEFPDVSLQFCICWRWDGAAILSLSRDEIAR